MSNLLKKCFIYKAGQALFQNKTWHVVKMQVKDGNDKQQHFVIGFNSKKCKELNVQQGWREPGSGPRTSK